MSRPSSMLRSRSAPHHISIDLEDTSVSSSEDLGDLCCDVYEGAPVSSVSPASSGSLSEFSAYDHAKLRKRSTPGQTPCGSWQSYAIRAVLFLAFAALAGSHLATTVRNHLEQADFMHDDLVQEQEKLLHDLHSKADELNQKYEAAVHDKVTIEQTLETTSATVKSLEQQLSAEQKSIQQFIKGIAVSKYGQGPHFVEFQVRMWESDKVKSKFFTVEMSSLEHMPLSTYTFLEQVDNKLWDGTSFYLNEPHAFSARPVSGNGQVSKRQSFVEKGLAELPFSEHSPEYPHNSYTLGFGPTGPSFYINKADNLSNRDPCFGEVVIGRNVVDQMTKQITAPDYRIHPIEIVQVKRIRQLSQDAMARRDAVKRV